MVQRKLRPEEFEACGGIRNSNIKWISGSKLLEKLGFNPVKCQIVVDETGHLNVRQNDHADYTCAPKLWRKISSD